MHHVMLTLWVLSGVGLPREVRVESPAYEGAPARLQATVGAFEVQPKNAELLRRMLAGEPTDVQFYAGGD